MNILQVVMTHPEAMPIYMRHRPIWERMKLPILTYTTASHHPSRYPKEVLAFGSPCHNGPASLDRFRYLIHELSNRCKEQGHEYVLINEYDSFCLSPSIPTMLFGDCIWSNLHFEKPGTRFVSTHFLHPPLFMSAKILHLISGACDTYRDQECGGFWDRMLGYLCEKAGIPMMPYGPLGYSTNTIHAANIPHAIGAALRGALFFHGVKTPEALAAIESAYAKQLCAT